MIRSLNINIIRFLKVKLSEPRIEEIVRTFLSRRDNYLKKMNFFILQINFGVCETNETALLLLQINLPNQNFLQY